MRRRAAAKKTENLKCPGKRNIKIVGLVPLNEEGRPASSSAKVCPYLADLLPKVQGKCNGRQQCNLSPRDIAVSKKQCPGVGSVNFRVRCIKKGLIDFTFFTPTTFFAHFFLIIFRQRLQPIFQSATEIIVLYDSLYLYG